MTDLNRRAAGEDLSLNDLIEHITLQLQAGECIDAEHYVAAYPRHAEQLRRLIPSMQALASFASSAASDGSVPPPLPPSDRPMPEVLGDFRILREIGSGGMGVVYEAEQISLGRHVALKVLPFANVLDERQLHRFKNEARAAAGLHHGHIVPVFSVGCERGVHYYAMQYIAGQSLAEVLQDLRRTTSGPRERAAAGNLSRDADDQASASARVAPSGFRGADPSGQNRLDPNAAGHSHDTFRASADTESLAGLLTETTNTADSYFRRVARLGVQLADALAYAHSFGVTHRDIKPANVLLDARGCAWVTDFGLARMQSEAGLTMTGDVLGTLRYMSPEQLEGHARQQDHRSDIYSLGATLYELVTLEPAFSSRNRAALVRQILQNDPTPPRRICLAVPLELETIILKSLAKEPHERYQTALEMAEDLARFVDNRPILAQPPTMVDRLRKWSRRNGALVTTAGSLLILIVISMIVGGLLVRNERTKAAYEYKLRKQEEFAHRQHQAELRQHEYDVNILLADQAWHESRVAQAKDYLARCLPRPGVDDLRGIEWHLLSRLCHNVPAPMGQHQGRANSVGFSPNGQWVATGGEDGVRVWEYRTGNELVWLPLHQSDVNSVQFSANGAVLVTASDDRTVRLWDTTTWEVQRTIEMEHHVGGAGYSPDGKYLGVVEWAAPDRSEAMRSPVTMYETATWTPAWKMSDLQGLEGGAISPDSSKAVLVGRNGHVGMYDMATGKLILDNSRADIELSDVAFSPRDPLIAIGTRAGFIHCESYHPEFKLSVALYGHTEGIDSVAFTPKGDKLLSASIDGTVRVWTFLPWKPNPPVTTMILRHPTRILSVRVAPDGLSAVTAAADGTVTRWDLNQPTDAVHILDQEYHCETVGFLSGNRLVAAGHGLGIYDAHSGKRLIDTGAGEFWIRKLVVSPLQNFIATVANGVVAIWDAHTLETRHVLTGLRDVGSVLTFSPDESMLIVGASYVRQECFNVQTGAPVPRPAPLHNVGVSLAYSPDGRFLAVGRERTTEIWDLAAATEAPTVREGNSPVFSSDGRWMALTAGGVESKVWVLRTGDWEEVNTFVVDPGASIALSGDGSRLAARGKHGTLKLWNVATGRHLMTLVNDATQVHSIVFSPDGSMLAARIRERHGMEEIRIWHFGSGPAGGVPGANLPRDR